MSVAALYGDFAAAATTVGDDGVESHVTGSPGPDDFLPILVPTEGNEGLRITAMPSANDKVRLYGDASTSAYTLVRRLVMDAGSWQNELARVLGISDAKFKALTASHKQLNPAAKAARASLPRKAQK